MMIAANIAKVAEARNRAKVVTRDPTATIDAYSETLQAIADFASENVASISCTP